MSDHIDDVTWAVPEDTHGTAFWTALREFGEKRLAEGATEMTISMSLWVELLRTLEERSKRLPYV